jgi:histidinol-phosphate aminotransferase
MKMNKNLSPIQNYPIEVIDKNITRCHANESQSSILPIAILAKNILDDLNRYPEKSYQDLENEASKFYNTENNLTIPVNGSDEGLDLIIRTFCNPNDEIVILNPTFAMYKQYAIAFGLRVLEFDLDNNFELNIEEFIAFCQKNNPKVVFIPNPLAPTGNVTNRLDLIKIIENIPETFVVIDEAYIEFSNQQSMIDLLLQYPNLIVTRTLSKFFGLAGVRLGFVFTQYKSEIMKIKSPYNVNQISCRVGINLFQNLAHDIINNRYNQNLIKKEKMIK